MPLQWAMTQNSLAIALGNLGERKSGTAKLEEANRRSGLIPCDYLHNACRPGPLLPADTVGAPRAKFGLIRPIPRAKSASAGWK
jgi:hypothetical protein